MISWSCTVGPLSERGKLFPPMQSSELCAVLLLPWGRTWAPSLTSSNPAQVSVSSSGHGHFWRTDTARPGRRLQGRGGTAHEPIVCGRPSHGAGGAGRGGMLEQTP